MDFKGLIFGKPSSAANEDNIRDPMINWIIIISTVFTTFAFWGWISSWLVEYARDRGMSTSTIYLIIFVVSLSILASTFLFYWYFIKSRRDIPPDHNPPEIIVREKQ